MRDIRGFEGKYAITSCGRVWSYRTKQFLKPEICATGYARVMLQHKPCIRKTIHRLVAEAYLDNPDNLPMVNHIDENKLNNSINNLEWSTYSHNMAHSKGKKVKCVETGEIFPSISDCARAFSTFDTNISDVVNKAPGHHTVKGLHFEFG